MVNGMVSALLLLWACVQVTPPPPPPPPPVDRDAAALAALDLPPAGRVLVLVHSLSFPDPQGADEAVARLAAEGLRARADQDQGEAWAVEATERRLLTAEGVRERRLALSMLAQELGGTYEGWVAEEP